MEQVENMVACPEMSNASSLEGLQARVRDLQLREKELMEEKEQAELEFRANRAKFRELFMQKEEELNRCREREQQLEDELTALKRELGDAKSEVTVMQCTMENEIEMERRKCAEEIATLQRLMDERMEEARRAAEARYEGEIRHLREKLDNSYRLLANSASVEPRDTSMPLPSVSPSVLSVVSKTLAKTVDRIQSFDKLPSFQGEEAVGKCDRTGSYSEDDAELLQSLVSTLEQQVNALKDKLRVADEQLGVFEANQYDLIKGCDALAKLVSGESPESVMAELDAKMREASASRDITISDLELHIAVLNAQKATLREDVDRMRTQMHELRTTMDKERRTHHELKETFAKAHELHLKAERDRNMEDMKRMNEVVASEQLKLEEMRNNPQQDGCGTVMNPGNPGNEHGSASERPSLNTSTPPKVMVTLEESDTESPPGENQSKEEKQILVSEKEWNLLRHEVEAARDQFVKTCPMCANYEVRLQNAQKDQKAQERHTKSLEQALERYKEDLNRESRYRKEMEEKWLGLSKEYERQVTELYRNLEAREKECAQMREESRLWIREVTTKVKELTAGRDAAQQEITKLRAENDDLVGKHSVHSQELQNEVINFPDTVEELQELLLTYREDLIAAKVAKEALQDAIKRDKRIFKDRILAEQQHKDELEDQLHQEIEHLREKLFILEGVQEALEKSQREKSELHRIHEEMRQRSEDSKMNDGQLIQVLKKSVEQLNGDKSKLEAEVHRLQCKNSSLTQDLNNSEAVQRDFVKLSQSLQVQLEKIRSSEKEVRWQEPEDVDECNSCKNGFSRSRKKNNCKHCGKVFCPDCLSKNVPCGRNGRPAKVCDVCHTLLVSNTAPYFSTDPPNTPD